MTYNPLTLAPLVGGIGVALASVFAHFAKEYIKQVGGDYIKHEILIVIAWFAAFVFLIFNIINTFMFTMYYLSWGGQPKKKVDLYEVFKPSEWVDAHRFKRVSLASWIEAYIHEKCDFKDDVCPLEFFEFKRLDYFHPMFHLKHYGEFFFDMVPQLFNHTQIRDVAEIQETYDKGEEHNFYSRFLGPSMMYTSGIYKTGKETLEEAQDYKLEILAKKLKLKKGDKHLDFGCGWGTLGNYSATKYGTTFTGVTLSRDGKKHCEALFKKSKLKPEQAKIALCDYRDAPGSIGTDTHGKIKYNKISNVEMSEHVGVFNYATYCKQVYDLLEDDGLYYLQIAGLRRAWTFEDLIWGLFMNKYIFPGADASCPLAFTVEHLEKAGFECRTIENIGIHYSETIRQWCKNWLGNEKVILKEHGQYWYRLWVVFLAWSTVAAKEGFSTCWQIVAHKNKSSFDRSSFFGDEQCSYTTAKDNTISQ